MDRHRLLCGDATNTGGVAELMDDTVAAAASIDVPFGGKVKGFYSKTGLHREFVEGSGDKSEAKLYDFFRRAFDALSTVLKPGAIVFAFIDWRELPILLPVGQAVFGKLINLRVWGKNRAGMGSFLSLAA